MSELRNSSTGMEKAFYLLAVCLTITFSFLLPGKGLAFQIIMFGDSLTQGYQRDAHYHVSGVAKPPNGRRIDGSYGPLLESLLASKEASFCFNWGVAGEKSSEAVNRIDTVLNTMKGDFILIQEGANDLIYGLSPETTRFNLGVLIEKAKRAGIKPILGEFLPMSCPRMCNADSRVSLFNDQVIAVAEEKHVVVAHLLDPFRKGWNTIPYQSGDGVHVSNNGYELMASLWYEAIDFALAQDDEETDFISKIISFLDKD